ncbi:MAG: amidohydrolase family protein [Proteobacteria bacterium]|nr:amidohydrolase family protein [Pseudomonadota bacterium]
MAAVILANATIVEAAGRRDGMHLRIDGERIAEIADRPLKGGDLPVIELGGKTVMPGLIDCHVHVMALSADIARLERLPTTYVAAHAAKIMTGMLRRGFTTVRDAGGADWGLKEAARLGIIDGPRLFIAGLALSQTGGHGDFRAPTAEVDACPCCTLRAGLARIADGVTEVRRAARDELRKGADQIKIMASGGVASPTDPIDNTQYSLEELTAIVEEAQAWNTYVMAHAYTPKSIIRSVQCGVRTIEHGNLIDDEAARLVARHQAFVVPTLVTYEAIGKFGRQINFPEESLAKLSRVADAGLRSLEICKRHGVRIGHGSDLLGEMHVHQGREFELKGEVLSPTEVLAGATTVNADILGRAGELGVVAEGALADLIVLDGDPMRNLGLLGTDGPHLRAVMKGGDFAVNRLG